MRTTTSGSRRRRSRASCDSSSPRSRHPSPGRPCRSTARRSDPSELAQLDLGPGPNPQPQRRRQGVVAADLRTLADEAGLDTPAGVTDLRVRQNDRVLDLDAFQGDAGADRAVWADIGLDHARAGPDVNRAADLRAIELGSRVDLDACLDARLRQADADAASLDPVEHEGVRLEHAVESPVESPQRLDLDDA